MAKPQPTDVVFVAVHPAEAEIEAFFAGTLDSPTRLRVFRHLLAGCADCSALCRPVLAGHARVFASVPSEEDYDAPIDRAFDGLREKVRAWSELIARSKASDDPGAGSTIKPPRPEDPRFVQLAWVDRLIGVARLLRGGGLSDYSHFAAEALDAALALASREPVESALWDLVARARAERANAWRLTGSTKEAIGELEAARLEAGNGSEGLPLIVEIASLEASAFMDARQFEWADTLLKQLEHLHRTTSDIGALGKVLMQRGSVAWQLGELARSGALHMAAFDALRATAENEMAAFAFKNAVDCYIRAGLYSEAGQLLPDLRRCLEPHASPIEIRKLRWMEAKCVAGVGCLELAVAELWALAAEFGGMKLPYHQALVVLDLCGIWLEQGRYPEIAEVARHLIQIFVELDIEREALKAIVLLEQAARQERATQTLLAAAIRQVEGLQSTGARSAR
jgi:hypothetical protein